ncbi:hypothetical protein [Methylosinus sp. Sm6]|uniref:hypothetical protein n=1 Tax=Methylosinus sp. Sm6 TaxID=2866948 RepID=UPI001C99F6C7|nr:hypothetical protein [Methylosinus sp. Sm6]MBY6240054.1 hypothetical protein [Methylosinus sp. Sm6]
MRAHPRSSRSGGQGRNIRLGALWLGILVLGGGFGAAAWTTLNRPPDAFELCQSGHIGVSSIILIDATDMLTEIQKRRVKASIDAERDRLPYGGKLTIVTLNAADPGQPVEVMSACNPGKASDSNPLFVTASKAQKRWAETFDHPITAAIREAGASAQSSDSPLIATIAALPTRPDFDGRTPTRRLVIISDMLEHVRGGYSHLGGGNFWKSYRASSLPRLAPLELRGVSVAIDYLARSPYAGVQGPAHRQFWRRLLTQAGASEVTFIGLPSADDDELDDMPKPRKSPSPKKKKG